MLALQNIFYFFIISVIIAIVVGALTKGKIEKQFKHGALVLGQLVGGVFALAIVVYLLSR